MTHRSAPSGRLSPAVFAVFVALTTGACLPRGDAPAGRQILADKTAVLLGLVPANGDGVTRVLFFRPGKDADNYNLWVLAVDPNGGPSSERMLFADIDSGLVLGYRPSATSGGFPMDSQGRLYLYQIVSLGPGDFTETVKRADPVTGEVVDIAQINEAVQSLSGPDQVPYVQSNYSGAPLTFDVNGGVTIPDVTSYLLVGTTAFYLTTDGTLFRLNVDGTSQQLATGVATWLRMNAQTLLITRAVPGSDMPDPGTDPFPGSSGPPAQVTGALLDTTTLVETPLPDGPLYQNGVQPSPSGRWLLVNEPNPDPNAGQDPSTPYSLPVLVDTVTGTIETLGPDFQYQGNWRPGHDELWTSLYDPNQTGLVTDSSLLIKRPGQPETVVPGVYFSGFNSDGTYWFSRGSRFDAQESSDLVGVADDPAGPRFPAVPTGSTLNYQWTLGDGRILDDSSVGLDSFDNYYVQIVDPRNGATDLVGELGYLATVGQTRALGLYHVSYLRGDLTTSDYASGRSTVLAAEFAMAAVAEPRGTDPYPPGGRIVYQFDARFDSPWDGLWMATVP